MKNMIPFVSLLLAVSACTGIPENKKNALPQDVERLSGEVRDRFIPDKRVILWDVDYDVSGKTITVKGATTSPEAKAALLSGLEEKAYEVKDSLQLVPDSAALEGKMYGIVNLSVCNMRVEDDFSSEMTTQALMGMPVKVLQHRNWYRIQTPDNYIAWVHRVGIHPVTKAGLDAWNKADKIVVTSHYGFTYQQPDAKSQSVSDVVAGNRLKYEGKQGGFYKVFYPDGRQAYISQGFVLFAAASMGIDSTPIEGADFDLLDEILELRSKGLRSCFAVSFGYRAADDANASRPKSRWPRKRIFHEI